MTNGHEGAQVMCDTGKTLWFIDEFGVVAPIVTVCFAIYFWRGRHELEVAPAASLLGEQESLNE